MSALSVSLIAFASVFAGALAGFALRRILPEHHFNEDSKEVIQLGTGLIATMAALVLGLLTASAKASFDTFSDELKQSAATVILLDRNLAGYGPETREIREALRQALGARIANWNQGAAIGSQNAVDAMPAIEQLQKRLRTLDPKDDSQKALQARALDLAASVATTRWTGLEQSASSVSWPFLIVMLFWLTAIFVSFGLLSSPNATLVVVLLVCALSVSTSIFLIFELDQPFQGLIHVSSEPLEIAYGQLGR